MDPSLQMIMALLVIIMHCHMDFNQFNLVHRSRSLVACPVWFACNETRLFHLWAPDSTSRLFHKHNENKLKIKIQSTFSVQSSRVRG